MINKSTIASTATILVIVLAITAIAPSAALANMQNWLNNTMNLMNNAAPAYYEAQKRGYAVGGNISAKFSFVDEPLVTFEGPSLKAGCGGIEGRLGAFSYLNFDQLVQKLQMILSAAPAFAFSLELKTLCEACENIIQTMEAITNMINQFNINSCNASKALAAGLVKQAAGWGISIGGIDASWYKQLNNTLTDVANSVKNFVNDYAGYYDCAMQSGQNLKTCLQVLNKIAFFESFWKTVFGGTDLKWNSLEGVFRGWFGDFKQTEAQTTDSNNEKSKGFPYTTNDPCDQPAPNIINAMVDGEYTFRASFGSACEDAPYPGGLGVEVQQGLDRITDNIRAGTPPTQQDINLINSTNIPVYSLLSIATVLDKIDGDGTNYYLSDAYKMKLQYIVPYSIAITALRQAFGSIQQYAKMRAAAKIDTQTDSPTLMMIGYMTDSLKQEIERAESVYSTQIQVWKAEVNSSREDYEKMRLAVYKNLARTKLLDSYLFAKGIR